MICYSSMWFVTHRYDLLNQFKILYLCFWSKNVFSWNENFFKDFKNADAIRTEMIMKGQQLKTNMSDYKSRKTKDIQKVSPPEFTSVLWISCCSFFSFLCSVILNHGLSFCSFPCGYCIVCSLIYGFWLPFWYLETLNGTWNIHGN